jgi:hypothetical protein
MYYNPCQRTRHGDASASVHDYVGSGCDGKKRVSLKTSSGQLTSNATWHDSVLVIESTLDIKVPNATVIVTGLKPVIDTWTLAADGRTLAHDAADHKEIYVYEKQ